MTLSRDSVCTALVCALVIVPLVVSAQNSPIPKNTPAFIKKATDLGAANPSTVITATVWLKLRNQNQLDRLVQQQYQKGSANYRKWVDQSTIDANFSPTAQTVNAVQNFLTAHNLTVLTVAENNFYIKVQGTIGAMEKAFKVNIHNYKLNGQTLRSNTGNPSVPSTISGHVAGVTGLDDLGFQPALARAPNPDGKPRKMMPLSNIGPNGVFFEGQCFRSVETDTFTGGGNTATFTGNRYGSDISNSAVGHLPPCGYSPAEMQTAYDMNPLFAAGWDGTGQTIVITDAYGSDTIQQDAAVFSEVYGLPPVHLQVLRAPGAVNNPHAGTWPIEVTLDVEWVHAMAPGAAWCEHRARDRPDQSCGPR